MNNQIGTTSNFPFKLPALMAIAVLMRQKSTYILDGDGETGAGVAIDTSTARRIKRVSDVMVYNKEIERWEVRQIRYLPGCPTIWVDEQEKLKFKSNNPADGAIWLESGSLTFSVEGRNIQKAMFIMLHENNASFEGNDQYKRPDGAMDLFFQIETERDAQKDVDQFDFEMEAKLYLNGLKKAGISGTTYNVDRLEFLSQLFKLPRYESEVGGKYGAETFSALIGKANENPRKFVETIGRYEAVVEADVQRAIGAGVVALDDLGASFNNGNVFLTFEPRTTQAEKHKAVLDFMLNPENGKLYEQMRSLTLAGLKVDSRVIVD